MGNPKLLASFIAILLLILSHCVHATSQNLSSRIFGGDAIDISQAKFVVQVISSHPPNMYAMCGGSLVTPFYVITAAHCVHHVRLADITVIGGATYYQTEGLRRRVRRKHMPANRSWDITVLRLQTPLGGRNIEPIKLCSTQCQTGDLINVYGWGKTSENDDVTQLRKRKLREVQLPVVDAEECELYFKAKIPKSYFCAGVMDEKDSSKGDSGGPAVRNNRLCGIVSGGGHRVGLGLYVDIAYVKSFLMRFIKFDACSF